MHVTCEELIREAVQVNHKRTPNKVTLEDDRGDLAHFAEYLASAYGRNLYTAQRKHVVMFLNHLTESIHPAHVRDQGARLRGPPNCGPISSVSFWLPARVS